MERNTSHTQTHDKNYTAQHTTRTTPQTTTRRTTPPYMLFRCMVMLLVCMWRDVCCLLCGAHHRFSQHTHTRRKPHLKVLCAPTSFSGRFSYSTCTNDFGAATHNERRFQFRLVNRLSRVLPGFMGKSLVLAVYSSTKRSNKTRSCT